MTPADEQAALEAIRRAIVEADAIYPWGGYNEQARAALAALRAIGWAPPPVVDEAAIERACKANMHPLAEPSSAERSKMRTALLAALSPEGEPRNDR